MSCRIPFTCCDLSSLMVSQRPLDSEGSGGLFYFLGGVMAFDYEKLVLHLKALENKTTYINSEEFISKSEVLQIMKLFKTYRKVNILSSFECLKTRDHRSIPKQFHYAVGCAFCGTEMEIYSSKSKFIDFLLKKFAYICKKCDEEKQRQKQAEEEQREKITAEMHSQDMADHLFDEYTLSYLTPENLWNTIHPGICRNKDKWEIITDYKYRWIWNDIKEFILKMNYKTFLNTEYWKIVASRKKYTSKYRCQLCNSQDNLETHHTTYEIRGVEIFNMDKLIVLCKNCHSKHHQ